VRYTPNAVALAARLAVGLAVGLTLTSCAASRDEPTDPTPSGPPPDAAYSVDIATGLAELDISYRLTNRSTEDLVVLNQMPAPPSPPNRDAVSVIGTSPAGRVQIAKRAFAKPDNVYEMQPSMVGGVIVGPGASVTETLRVPMPLQRIAPYRNDEGITLPDPVIDVVFCVGVLRLTEAPVATNDGMVVTVSESARTTSVQHLFCSAPYRLPHD